jgi:hypothetical protein
VGTIQISHSTLILGIAVLTAGAYALGRETASSEPPRVFEARPAVAAEHGASGEGDPPEEDLPADHPGSGMQTPPADDEAAAIRWTVPAAWRTMPNASSMRIATYAVPHASGDSVDADVSVTRAGGDVAANIQRWVSQFEGAGEPKRKSQTVHGLEVTVVELEGTYASAMSGDSKARPGWALLGAIVRSQGQPYFFKMTGPANTVHAARASFAALVDSIQPTT